MHLLLLFLCVKPSNTAVLKAPTRVWPQVSCMALLLLLFRVMARTADDFFACILSQISQDMGLPPRLAGVTLLALGNGAPDLSSCIAAVKTGNYRWGPSSCRGCLAGFRAYVVL